MKKNYFYFILSFLLIIIISLMVLIIPERKIRIMQMNETKLNEERLITLEKNYLGKEFAGIVADIHYLNHFFGNTICYEKDYESIAENWKIFSTEKGIYDQIRFIDINGNEKIRINKTSDGGYIVPKNLLQNKKNRYYFKNTIGLSNDYVYISQMDLNIENEEIEFPYKPMIRFSTPIYDDSGNVKGIIVINYLAKILLEDFRLLSENGYGDMMLLNNDSYWFSNSDPEKEWGFMFENNKMNFKNFFPNEWELIKSNKGQILTEKGLFTYASLNLSNKLSGNLKLGDPNWYIVSFISRTGDQKYLFTDDTQSLIIDILKENIISIILMLSVSIIIASLIFINRRSYSKIKYYSEYDDMTKTYNRRAGIDKLERIITFNTKQNKPLSLCFIDVNGLKEVNDILGHEQGDELIKTSVDIIKKSIGFSDFIIRLGGDEFLIIFDGLGEDESEKIWKNIVDSYKKINLEENRKYNISISHGIVSYENARSRIDDLIKIADEKMYDEKKIIKKNITIIK